MADLVARFPGFAQWETDLKNLETLLAELSDEGVRD